MSIFKRLFSKNNVEEINRINELFQNQEFEAVIHDGKALLKKLNVADKKRVIKLLALSHFNKNEPTLALPYFEDVATNSLNSDDWFNVASAAILSKQVDRGMNAFSKAIELYQKHGTPNSLTVGQMSFYVMQALKDTHEYDLAFVQLMKLKDVYCELKITDDTFLHIRGLPFLHHLLESSKEILKNQEICEAKKWLTEFASMLDDDGKSMVEKFAVEFEK